MLRILRSRFEKITEKGEDFIQKWIVRAVENDGFLMITIIGDRGFGKSTLGLNLTFNALKRLYPDKEDRELWYHVIDHTIFTIEDFDVALKLATLRWKDGRVPILLWDDFALHTSSYAFLRGEGGKVGSFIEDFEAVRNDLAVLIVTCATPEMIPPRLREAPQIYVEAIRRGKAKVYVKESPEHKRHLFEKILAWKYTITWGSVPKDVYREYKKLKIKAHEIKKKQRVLKLMDQAEKIAEFLKDQDWKEPITLSSYGIIDTRERITPFGELVLRFHIDKFGTLPPLPDNIHVPNNICELVDTVRTENELNRINLKEEFQKEVSQREFERLGMSCGIPRDKLRALYKLLLNRLNGYAEVIA